MTTVNLTCSICSENYVNKDEIISTKCGHIFHSSCFNDWISRSSSCPECRLENISTHRIYLHLEDAVQRTSTIIQPDAEKVISRLEGLLKESESSYRKLHRANFDKKVEMILLKEKIEYQEAKNASLEEELSKLKLDLKESEKNFFDLFEHISTTKKELKNSQSN